MLIPKAKMIVGNWKMNGSISTINDVISTLLNNYLDNYKDKVNIIICPPFTLLNLIKQKTENSPIKIGGQDCHFEQDGAFTGDISAKMLSDIGCEYVILGHSERRKNHFETNYLINKKIKAAHEVGLKTIVCVGEAKTERESGVAIEVINKQIRFSLNKDFDAQNTIIAYEPIWSIGTEVIPSAEQIIEVNNSIRETIKSLKDSETSDGIKILYGGSVNSLNSSEIFSITGVDGVLVGGASLKAKDFFNIINSINF